MAKTPPHKWTFRPRFRRHAYGWKSQPAITRVREAVSEIKKVNRTNPELAAEGAVLFLEKVSPAIEHVDSSSGAIGSAVNKAVDELAIIISKAPAAPQTRRKWLERLFEAHSADQIPYIENLAEHWGALCASPELASEWADDLINATRMALSPDENLRGYFHGTPACLSSLYTAGRFDELIELLKDTTFWHYQRWAALALAAQGKESEAIAFAESCRDAWASDLDIDRLCEQWLISTGKAQDAYARYGLAASRAGTYTAWFRNVAKKYPDKSRQDILRDLVAHTPGEEGKWFAAAKDVGLFEEAIELANRTPCSPQTLTRAARDFKDKNAGFAVEAGVTALRWLIEGYGYDITSVDVMNAYSQTVSAAENANCVEQTKSRLREMLANAPVGQATFVNSVITHRLESG